MSTEIYLDADGRNAPDDQGHSGLYWTVLLGENFWGVGFGVVGMMD